MHGFLIITYYCLSLCNRLFTLIFYLFISLPLVLVLGKNPPKREKSGRSFCVPASPTIPFVVDDHSYDVLPPFGN